MAAGGVVTGRSNGTVEILVIDGFLVRKGTGKNGRSDNASSYTQIMFAVS